MLIFQKKKDDESITKTKDFLIQKRIRHIGINHGNQSIKRSTATKTSFSKERCNRV